MPVTAILRMYGSSYRWFSQKKLRMAPLLACSRGRRAWPGEGRTCRAKSASLVPHAINSRSGRLHGARRPDSCIGVPRFRAAHRRVQKTLHGPWRRMAPGGERSGHDDTSGAGSGYPFQSMPYPVSGVVHSAWVGMCVTAFPWDMSLNKCRNMQSGRRHGDRLGLPRPHPEPERDRCLARESLRSSDSSSEKLAALLL